MALAEPLITMPYPLGAIKPNANTPLKITNNFTDIDSLIVQSVTIQALASNNAAIYVLCQTGSTAKDTTNYTNILAVLTAGQTLTLAGRYGNQIVLGNVQIDPTTSGQGAFAWFQQN